MSYDLDLLEAHLGALEVVIAVTNEPNGHKRICRNWLAECRRLARKIDERNG